MVRRIESSLAAGGYSLSRDSVAGRQAVVARRASFRLPARLHAFVLIASFKSDASRDHLDRFLEEAALYARTVRGGLAVGSRRGTSVTAVAVVSSARDAGGWGTGPSAVAAVPVLVDVAERRVSAGEHPPGGPSAVVIRDHVAPAVS